MSTKIKTLKQITHAVTKLQPKKLILVTSTKYLDRIRL